MFQHVCWTVGYVFIILSTPWSSLSEVGQRDQDTALAVALSNSLWLAGQEACATVTLVTDDYCITPHLDYKLDNFTEKVQLTLHLMLV